MGLWVGQSGDNRITHNEIADLFYTGISAGWTWGYGPNLAKRNTFAFNRVHHLGKGLLSDMGGIYTLGPSEGTVVANNVFHDIYAYSYGGWGLYTDEGSTGVLFENNLVYDTKTGGFHQHYGKDNVVRNNIFAFSKMHKLEYTRSEPHLSFTFEKNIVTWSGATPLLHGAWDRGQYDARNNWYWNAGGMVSFLGKSLAGWQAKGHEQGTQIVDPLFIDPAGRDFRLQPQSPALNAGFKEFNPRLRACMATRPGLTRRRVSSIRRWRSPRRRDKTSALIPHASAHSSRACHRRDGPIAGRRPCRLSY